MASCGISNTNQWSETGVSSSKKLPKIVMIIKIKTKHKTVYDNKWKFFKSKKVAVIGKKIPKNIILYTLFLFRP